MQLSSRLEKSTNEFQCMQNEASLKSTMLAQRYAVLETDYRLAQDAL